MTVPEYRANTRQGLEMARFRAGRDILAGVNQSTISRVYGVSRSTASRWARVVARGGPAALSARTATGHPKKLTVDQLAVVRGIYERYPIRICP